LEEKAYVWSEYARGDDREPEGGEVNKFVGGKMFFVKFGAGKRDPIWPIDIFLPQRAEAQTILACMLADAIGGFPVPFYPQCLQKAHENAALVDFDFDILQDSIVRRSGASNGDHGVRSTRTSADLRERGNFQATDIARRRMASDSGRRANQGDLHAYCKRNCAHVGNEAS
jgi:hypothetical protein